MLHNVILGMDKRLFFGSVLVLIILFCLITAGCTGTSVSAQNVTDANNRFAFDFYSRLANDPTNTESNIFFSPFSLTSTLSITCDGARGDTADEIRSVFHFPKDDAMRRQEFANISAIMNQEDNTTHLYTANALWAEKTYPFLPEYINTAQQYYEANVTNLDFINQPDDSRNRINTWVENRTNNKIQDLIPDGGINPSTRLVITNAIYFYGKWEKPFDGENTFENPFFITPDKSVDVLIMEQKDIFAYTETSRIQMIKLPYKHGKGKNLSMIVILPKHGTLREVENSLNGEMLSDLERKLTDTEVVILLPRFKLETRYELPKSLKTMGMPTAFTQGADFSGMDGTKRLYIDNVIQKAFIEVNEEGTEAAAASGMYLMSKGYSPDLPVFRADHPFLFLIQDEETGIILFIGRVVNPDNYN
jgi:serpin B